MLIDPSNERILGFILAALIAVALVAALIYAFNNWPDDDDNNTGWGGL